MRIRPLEFARSRWHAIQRQAPPWFESSILPPLFQLKEMVRLLSRPRLPTNEFFGTDIADGPKAVGVRLTPIGGLHSELLAQWPSERPARTTPFWRAGAKGLNPSADLIAVEGPLLFIKTLPRHNALVLPRCVVHTLDVTGEWQQVRQRFHKSVRTNELRRIRKHGFHFEKSTNTAHFEHFYERMYLPTMHRRHGCAAILDSKATANEFFENGFLLRVFKGGMWVAGGLCERRASGLRLCELGVLESNDALVKEGALGAAYIGAIQAANSMKCRQINLTVTASLLSNSTFQHKRKWGTSVSLPAWDQQRIWIQIARYTPAIHRLLTTNPMITVDQDGQLQAVAAIESLDHWTAPTAERWRRQYYVPGLSSIRLLPLDRFRETGVLSFATTALET